MICGSQGLRLVGRASSSSPAWAVGTAGLPIRGGGEQRQPGPRARGRGAVRCSTEQRSVPTEGECGKKCWESHSLVPPERGAEQQLKQEPPGNTSKGFNSVHAA